MKKAICLFIMVFLILVSTYGQFVDGSSIKEMYKNYKSKEYNFATTYYNGYISGVVDGYVKAFNNTNIYSIDIEKLCDNIGGYIEKTNNIDNNTGVGVIMEYINTINENLSSNKIEEHYYSGYDLYVLWKEYKKVEVLNKKDEANMSDATKFIGYVKGSIDWIAAIMDIWGEDILEFSLPKNLEAVQACLLTGYFLEKNPKLWNESGYICVGSAIADAFAVNSQNKY